MENIFKNFLYTGVGIVSIASEKFKNSINDLIKNGKISAEEGKKIVDDFVIQSEEDRKKYEGEFKTALEKTLDALKFAKKDEVDKLKNRVEVLENLVAKKNEEKIPIVKLQNEPKGDEPRKEE